MKSAFVTAGAMVIASCVVPVAPASTSTGRSVRTQELTSASAASSPSRMTIRATAPQSMGDHQLGRPYDEFFRRFPGQDGRSLFESATSATQIGANSNPQSPTELAVGSAAVNSEFVTPPSHSEQPLGARPGGIVVTKPNMFRHEATVIEDTRQLRANASAWFLSGELGQATQERYATYSAMQIAEIHEVDDTMDLRTAPDGAVWYLSKIYYGRSYQVVLSGSQETFHAGVKAKFLSFGAGIEGFAKTYKLRTTAVGRGLKPKESSGAIFARTPEEVALRYIEAGDLAPIFVEYTLIPGGKASQPEVVSWNAAPPAPPVFQVGRYRVVSVRFTIGSRSRGGTYWDPDGDFPDPGIHLSVDGSEIATCREQDWNIASPVSCQVDKIISISAKTLVNLSVVDRDAFADDAIGTAELRPGGMLSQGQLEMEATGDISRVFIELEGPL